MRKALDSLARHFYTLIQCIITITCAGLGGSATSNPVRIDIDALGLPGWKEIIPR